jgi:hypothetical protein
MLKILKDTKNAIQSYGGIHIVNELIRKLNLNTWVEQTLGKRPSQAEYSYTDAILNCCYISYIGGTCLEDAKILKKILKGNSEIKVADSDTLGRIMKKLSVEDKEYKQDNGVVHRFNRNEKLNDFLLSIGLHLHPEWRKGVEMDYDSVIIETEKWDSSRTYKNVYGYQPGVAFIGRSPIYVEGRSGNTSAKTRIAETVRIILNNLERKGIPVKRFRADAAAYNHELIRLLEEKGIKYCIRATHTEHVLSSAEELLKWETIKDVGSSLQELKATEVYYTPQGWDDKKRRIIVYARKRQDGQLNLLTGEAYEYFSIVTNDEELSVREVVERYYQRGTIEKNFDILKNDFNWKYLPFSEMKHNVVFMILMAIGYVLYDYLLKKISVHFKEISEVMRIKGFILHFMSVCCKWIKRGREYVLKLYTDAPYEQVLSSG